MKNTFQKKYHLISQSINFFHDTELFEDIFQSKMLLIFFFVKWQVSVIKIFVLASQQYGHYREKRENGSRKLGKRKKYIRYSSQLKDL